MKDDIKNKYGGKTRVRVCGICVKKNAILLVNHGGLTSGEFWAPPGGGVGYLEDAKTALKRELKEEAKVDIEIKQLLFVNEYESEPLHAIELFFEIELLSEAVEKGVDPEHDTDNQIIKEVRFVTFDELAVIDDDDKHNILHNVNSKESILNMRGYFHFSR